MDTTENRNFPKTAQPMPPPPPPDRIGIGWTVIDNVTGEVREFDGNWQGVTPWKLTQLVIHKKMVPDGRGWKPVRDNIEVILVDVQAHTIVGVDMEPHIWKKVQEILAAE